MISLLGWCHSRSSSVFRVAAILSVKSRTYSWSRITVCQQEHLAGALGESDGLAATMQAKA